MSQLPSVTIEQVPAELNCDYSTYGKLENGHTSMDLDRFLKIAKILETNASVLLGETDATADKSNRIQLSVHFDMSPEEFKKAGLDKKIHLK
jgi:transcriptional regulator with XRE-family HTH domain